MDLLGAYGSDDEASGGDTPTGISGRPPQAVQEQQQRQQQREEEQARGLAAARAAAPPAAPPPVKLFNPLAGDAEPPRRVGRPGLSYA